MSDHSQQNIQQPALTGGGRAWIRTNGSFLIASAVILVAGVGWNSAMDILEWTMVKYAVPNRDVVRLSDHRLDSFPKKIGHYELNFASTVEDEMLGELGMKKHDWNWYYFAQYQNTKLSKRDARARVLLRITYYTGLLDAVPHITEKCVQAGGGVIDKDRSGVLPVVMKDVPPGWENVELRRVAYMSDGKAFAQYRIFSMNGDPTASWMKVRATLGSPWVKYCYFAKIEVAPRWPNLSDDVNDKICREFVETALPEVLKYLPTRADVDNLKHSEGS